MSEILEGHWDKGLAFDVHTLSSTYLGVSEAGYDQFDTEYTKMGGLLLQLKYRNNRGAVPKIIKLLDKITGIEKFDAFIPIPATKKDRPYQPVELIAVALGKKRDVPVLTDLLLNGGDEELKGVTDPIERINLLKSAITLNKPGRVRGKKVLLIDDLYRSGSTLNVATDILRDKGGAKRVCVLTMTKTRSNR